MSADDRSEITFGYSAGQIKISPLPKRICVRRSTTFFERVYRFVFYGPLFQIIEYFLGVD